MRDQPLAVHQELILLRFTTENGMVFKDQDFHSEARLPLEEEGGSKSADSATDDDTIVSLASIDDVVGQRVINSVADGMPGLQDCQGVPVGRAVFADSAITGKFVASRKEFRSVVDSSNRAPDANSAEPRKSRRVMGSFMPSLVSPETVGFRVIGWSSFWPESVCLS